MRYLSRIMREQVLTFQFPFSEFDVYTDLKVCVLSREKSLLPVSGLSSRGTKCL